MLQIKDVTRRFGTKAAVDRVSFGIERSAFVGIIGRSGAGKSTLLRMINRLTDATSGEIMFDGCDVLTLQGGAKRAWQSQRAMIFQQFNLVPRMDVASNVPHGILNRRSTLATMFNLWPKADILNALQILNRLGIAEQAAKRAEALSGGQRQRVAIARAVMQGPRGILADELGRHKQTIVDVDDGTFVAGVSSADGQANWEDGYNSGALRKAADAGLVDMNNLVEIWRSTLIPEGPMVVRAALPQDVKDTVTQLTADLWETDKECAYGVASGEAKDFVPVAHDEYPGIPAARELQEKQN